MTAPADNKDLSQAPSSGEPTTDMLFAVQQPSATGIIQKVLQSTLSITSQVSGQGFTIVNRWMTPKAFTETIGNSTNAGTFKLAETADIAAGTAVDKALTPSNKDDLKSDFFAPSAINSSDIDAVKVPASSTITNWDVRKNIVGKSVKIKGNFDFTVATENKVYIEFTLNNTPSPVADQGGSAAWVNSSASGIELERRFAAGVQIYSGGTNILKIRLGQTEASAAFGNGNTYKIYLDLDYFSV